MFLTHIFGADVRNADRDGLAHRGHVACGTLGQQMSLPGYRCLLYKVHRQTKRDKHRSIERAAIAANVTLDDWPMVNADGNADGSIARSMALLFPTID